MTVEEIENNRVVNLCHQHLDNFTDIYGEEGKINPLPDDVRITVYCKGISGEGFLVNISLEEMGLEELIAEKWIIHSELEALCGRKIA